MASHSQSRPGSANQGSGCVNASTDLLKILQRQKQETLRIERDPIFKEYHAQVKLRELKLRCKGWKDVAKPQIDEDLDAEAMQRMVALVATSAAEDGKNRAGVWARFGKPYKPLGLFQEVLLSATIALRSATQAHLPSIVVRLAEGESRPVSLTVSALCS